MRVCVWECAAFPCFSFLIFSFLILYNIYLYTYIIRIIYEMNAAVECTRSADNGKSLIIKKKKKKIRKEI